VVSFSAAALAAFGAWFVISDMVGDWYEVHSPEYPVPGQPEPSYWAEHGYVKTGLGLTLWFLPSLSLLVLSFSLLFRAIAVFSPQPPTNARQSTTIA
jgi:hypothetical protein